MKSLSIRTYLLLLIFTMTAIPLVVIVSDTFKQYRHNKSESYLMLERLAHDIESDQKAFQASTEQLLTIIDALPAVQQRDSAAVNRLLAQLLKRSPQLTNVIMANTSGHLWAAATPFAGSISIADRRYFRNALTSGSFSSGEFATGRIRNKPVISFGYPIKDPSGNIRDIAAVSFPLENYEKLLSARKYPAGTSLVLTDHQGTILYSSVGSQYTGKKDKLFRHMLDSTNGGRFEAYGNSGIRRIHFYKPVQLNSETSPYLYIRAGMASSVLRDELQSGLFKYSSLMLLLLLAASGTTLYLSKTMVLGAIDTLHRAMSRVAEGDLTVRVSDYVSGRELGGLGRSFDQMTERLNRDITERTRSEEELRRSEEKFAAIFNNSPDSININNLETSSFVDINDGFCTMFGYSRTEVIGQPSIAIGVWVDPEDRHRLAEQLRNSGSVKNLEAKLRRKDGTIISVLISSTLININGVACTLNIARDITERDLILAEFSKMHKLESLGVLAGGIAHDFNNILTSIMGNISFAKLKLDDPGRAQEVLTNAEKASQRASELAKQLLVFAKGGMPVKKTLSVAATVNDALSLVLTGTNVKSVLNLSEQLYSIEADEGQLNQTFHNIIINAVQAMPGGGTLTVSGHNSMLADDNPLGLAPGSYVVVTFTDQGCGISAEDQLRIFDPYFTTKAGGNGLGLASSYAIIKNHGGRLTVSSAIGSGATFTIYLPAQNKAELAPVSAKPTAIFTTDHGTILVMDDEAAIRELASETLSYFGYTATTCATGEEAVALYRAAHAAGSPYGAVILDLTIPGAMGGEEAAGHILSLDPQAVLVASSGYADNPVMASPSFYGFKTALEKPYDIGSLSSVLKQVLPAQ